MNTLITLTYNPVTKSVTLEFDSRESGEGLTNQDLRQILSSMIAALVSSVKSILSSGGKVSTKIIDGAIISVVLESLETGLNPEFAPQNGSILTYTDPKPSGNQNG